MVYGYDEESTRLAQSVITGFDTVGTTRTGYTSEYTTDSTTTTDDSEDSPPHRRRHRANSYSGRDSSSQRLHKGYTHSPPRRGNRSVTRDDDMWGDVAEDMGIIAGLLISDGTACLSTACSITAETVTSCRGNTGNRRNYRDTGKRRNYR